VTVLDELPRFVARGGKAQAKDDVVETSLEQHQQILTRLPLHRGSLVERSTELPLEQSVHTLDLLLLAQLHAVVGEARPALSVDPGRIRPALDRTLLAEAAVSLQEELGAFPPTKSTCGSQVSCHV